MTNAKKKIQKGEKSSFRFLYTQLTGKDGSVCVQAAAIRETAGIGPARRWWTTNQLPLNPVSKLECQGAVIKSKCCIWLKGCPILTQMQTEASPEAFLCTVSLTQQANR